MLKHVETATWLKKGTLLENVEPKIPCCTMWHHPNLLLQHAWTSELDHLHQLGVSAATGDRSSRQEDRMEVEVNEVPPRPQSIQLEKRCWACA